MNFPGYRTLFGWWQIWKYGLSTLVSSS